jgi:hypothetical protein
VELKRYGRTIQLALSWVGLLGFPAGTFVSIVSWSVRPGVKLLFSNGPDNSPRSRQIAAIRGLARLVNRRRRNRSTVVAVTGIAAALAIPGLLRARMSGNEAAAIGTLHHQPAQGRYAAVQHARIWHEANRPAGLDDGLETRPSPEQL